MANKKNFSNAADEFFTKPQAVPNESDVSDRKDIRNSISFSDRISNRKADILSDIESVGIENATHSFYMSGKIYNALVSNAKAKKMSTSKFLEAILKQLFAEEE